MLLYSDFSESTIVTVHTRYSEQRSENIFLVKVEKIGNRACFVRNGPPCRFGPGGPFLTNLTLLGRNGPPCFFIRSLRGSYAGPECSLC